MLDTTLSLLVPYVAYLAAEEVGGSGVLAVVMAGLILGHKSPDIQSAGSRVTERTLWRSVQFILENSVFLLIGLQLRSLLEKARASSVDNRTILVLCVGVTLTVIVVRVLWMFPAVYLPRAIPAIRRTEPQPPWQNVVVLSWAGMRGVVTLAAAFALPRTLGESPALIIAAFSVVAATLLLQGSTLPALVRLLRVPGPDRAQDALQQALVLQRAVDAGRAELDEASERHPEGRRRGPPLVGRAGRPLGVGAPGHQRRAVRDPRPGRSGGCGWPCSGRSATRSWRVTGRARCRPRSSRASWSGSTRRRPCSSPSARGPRPARPTCSPRRAARSASTCDRAAGGRAGTPTGASCLAIGAHDWVSLRMCLHCGHVGCCDSSPAGTPAPTSTRPRTR